MRGRIAPENGYDFGNKKQYRRSVWKTASEYFNGQVADKTILIMPSAEGDEIDVAKSKGFREKNIIICDMNPAIVAVLKRRYPLVRGYGVSLDRAALRMATDRIQLDVLNADLCGPIGAKYLRTLGFICASRIMAHRSIVFMTMLRGRESFFGIVPDFVKNTLHGTDTLRMMLACETMCGVVQPEDLHLELLAKKIFDSDEAFYRGEFIRHEVYKSSCGQTMLWCALGLSKKILSAKMDADVRGFIKRHS